MGIIKDISYYGGKGDVKVQINNGESHILDLYSIKKDNSLEIGDSLFKAKEELDLYHFKKDRTGNYYFYNMYSYSTFLIN